MWAWNCSDNSANLNKTILLSQLVQKSAKESVFKYWLDWRNYWSVWYHFIWITFKSRKQIYKLWSSKVQSFSKQYFWDADSPKVFFLSWQNRKTNSFVHCFGESAALQFCFEIYWSLVVATRHQICIYQMISWLLWSVRSLQSKI